MFRHGSAPSRRRNGSGSGVAQQFGGQRPGHRAAEPQRLGVEQFDGLARGGIGALDPVGEIAHHGLVDGQLAVGAEFDDQGAKQLVVGRQQRHHRHRAQPRAQIAQFDLERRRAESAR